MKADIESSGFAAPAAQPRHASATERTIPNMPPCDDDYLERAHLKTLEDLINDADGTLTRQQEYSLDVANLLKVIQEQACHLPEVCSVARAALKLVLGWDHEMCVTAAMLEISLGRLKKAQEFASPATASGAGS